MIQLMARRVIQLGPLLLIMSFIVFLVTSILPGDAATSILGEYGTKEDREALRKELGLDRPILIRYGTWLVKTASGDLGTSLKSKQPVAEMLIERIPVTFEVALLAVALSVTLGIPLGIVAALKRNTWVDTVTSAVSLSSMAIPYFWVGILIIMLFSIRLEWLPPSGYVPFLTDPLQNLKFMIMPVLTIGTAQAAVVMRQTRASMLGVLSQDFVRTARAKGASESRVIFRHALRNALIPVATVIGLQMGALMGGTVVIETIFSLPGLGRMIVDAISQRDYPVVQGAVIVLVLGVLIVNLLTDLSYILIDRRVKI